MSESKSNSFPALILGICLAVGLIGSSWMIGESNKSRTIASQPNYIILKAEAEMDSMASEGTWKVGIKAWAQTYADAMNINKEQIVTLVTFLVNEGFAQENFELQPIVVEEYKEGNASNGFYATRFIHVSSKQLAQLKKAFANIQELRSRNNTILFEAPVYKVTNLEQVKQQLTTVALENAQQQATNIANTGKLKLGNLANIRQDYFELQPYNSEGFSVTNQKARIGFTVEYTAE